MFTDFNPLFSPPSIRRLTIYIRDLLGHSDVSTTEIYARADETMKRKALLEAYESPSEEQLPTWKKDKDLLDWLKSL